MTGPPPLLAPSSLNSSVAPDPESSTNASGEGSVRLSHERMKMRKNEEISEDVTESGRSVLLLFAAADETAMD